MNTSAKSIVAIVVAAIAAIAIGIFMFAGWESTEPDPDPTAPMKKLVLLTYWEENPEFNKWYVEKGQEFGKRYRYEVDVLTIPYAGWNVKYQELLTAKTGAPDMFMGLTHEWCGQHNLCAGMPSRLRKVYDSKLPAFMNTIGVWNGTRYGVPVENGNFPQMYINVDMFKAAGLNPDEPPKNMKDFLEAMKKLTIAGPDGGEPVQSGFVASSNAHPVNVTFDFLSLAHAFGARMLSPALDKATGHANSPEMVAALTFFSDLALKHKVSSIHIDNPLQAFGKKRAAVIFSPSWYASWLKKNAPDVNYRMYGMPCEKLCPGPTVMFPLTDLVNKNSPNASGAWKFIEFISNARDDLEHHERQGLLPVWAENIESDYVKGRPDYRSIKEMLSRPPAPNYAHPKLFELSTAFGEAVLGVLLGKGSPQALLDSAAARMDGILKQ